MYFCPFVYFFLYLWALSYAPDAVPDGRQTSCGYGQILTEFYNKNGGSITRIIAENTLNCVLRTID